MKEFVLDCSVTLSWFFGDECDPYSLSIRESLRRSRAHTPAIWPLEVANGLLVAQRKNRLTASDVLLLTSAVKFLRVFVEEKRPETWIEQVVAIARQYDLSAYDAAYLELAIRLGLPIATLDGALLRAAESAGLPRFEP